jgi:hypothetical protein
LDVRRRRVRRASAERKPGGAGGREPESIRPGETLLVHVEPPSRL